MISYIITEKILLLKNCDFTEAVVSPRIDTFSDSLSWCVAQQGTSKQ
jgi:hypothetical protein